MGHGPKVDMLLNKCTQSHDAKMLFTIKMISSSAKFSLLVQPCSQVVFIHSGISFILSASKMIIFIMLGSITLP